MTSDRSKFRFLDLPPELRNHVYSYTLEDPAWGENNFAPHVRPALGQQEPSQLVWHTRPWGFFAFTRVCSQIRAELRPVWLKSIKVRIEPKDMPPFVEGFLHGAWKDAPNLIQILIRERARDAETAPFSLWVQPFLIVRAMNPHTWFELIPHNLIEEATIAQKTLCKYCLDTHCLEKARPPVLHKRFHQDCQAEDNHSNMIRPGPDIMRPISYEYLYFRNSIATQTLERFLRSNSARFYQDWKCQQHVTHVDAEIAVGKRNDFLSIRFWCGANLWATVRNSDAPEQLLKILGIQYPMARGICYKLIVPAVGQDKGNRGTAFKEGVKIHCIHGRSTYHLKEPDNVQI